MASTIFNGNAIKLLKNILRFQDGTDLSATDAANLSGTTGNLQDQIDDVVADVAAIPDPISYQGTWNASTNTPTLANTDTGVTGYLYQVNVAGSVNFGAGAISFEIGDKVVNNGSVWEKWDMTDSVTSVNGQTGVVVVTKSDVGLSNVDNTSDATKNAATATLTNKTLTAPVINSPTGIVKADVGLSNVDNTSDATKNAASVTLTNKTIDADQNTITNIENADIKASAAITYSKLNLASSIVNADVSNSAAIALDKLAAQTASRAAAFDASGFLVPATTTAAELDFVAGSRSALQTQIDGQATNNARNLNWITNYGAEVNSTGYNAYADTAQSTPVDGTGGSPNVTISRSTTTPLDGAADLNFVKDAANRQGQGFSYDFTIDRAYQGAIQQISFNYEVVSGTYASGDLTVWVYDVTNAALLSQPSGNSIISTSVPSQQGQCTFQTAINSTSYRLIFHVASTSASAYTLAFDNISVGPQVNANGGVDTDWVDFSGTPTTQGFGSPTFSTVRWRREGPDLLYQVRFTPGTVAASEAQFGLPAGLSVATGPNANSQLVGECFQNSASAGNPISVLATPGDTFVNFGNASAASATKVTPGNGDTSFVSSVACSFEARIPIAGWSPNTVLSTSANTRAVVFTGTQSSEAITGSATNITFTSTKDTAAGWSTNIYTVRVPGDYFVGAAGTMSSNSGLAAYRNGSLYSYIASIQATPNSGGGGTLVRDCAVGETLSIRGVQTNTFSAGTVSIFLLQSPQQIAASEDINARYFASATSISSSLATIVWTTRDFDSHNALSSGVYTVPAPGKYQVNVSLAVSGTFVLNNTSILQIQRNGTAVVDATRYIAAAITNEHIQISDIISCAANDTIRVQYSTQGTAPSIVSSNTKNFISIARVGN